MSAPVWFHQVLDTALYETREPASSGWAGFVVTVNVDLPPKISISKSLNGDYNGAYLFCVERPEVADKDPGGFARAVVEYVNESIFKQNRAFFWLQSSSAPYFGPFPQFGFPFGVDTNNRWKINDNMNAKLGRNLTLNVNQSLIVKADETNALISLSFPGSSVALVNLQAGAKQIIVASRVTAWVPLSGPNTGCLLFTASMEPAVVFAQGTGGLSQGFQYTYNNKDGQAQQLFFPAFNTGKWPAKIPVIATVDPSDPVNSVISAEDLQTGHLRTALVMTGMPWLASNFLTPQGNAISLVPVGSPVGATAPALQAGALALASASPLPAKPGSAQVFFAPAGQFGVSGAGTPEGKPLGILGGLFGSECITLSSYKEGAPNNVLCFVPSQPAFAPVFPFEYANLENPGSGSLKPRLTAAFQTPWATVLAGGGANAVYQSEPEGSSLYGIPLGATATAAPPILLSTPPQMPLEGTTKDPFPLAPYSKAPVATAGLDTLRQFESQIIAPTRKKATAEAAVKTMSARAHARRYPRAAAEQQFSTSPQGFLITSDPSSGAYLNVLLAQSASAGGVIPFAFASPVTQQLENALQSNQLFLVAVNSSNLGPFKNVANVAGWTLSAQVGRGVTATSYRNVMIMKFCSGSVLERVTNPNRWTSAEDFSLAPGTSAAGAPIAYAGLSQWLRAYVLDGIKRSKETSAAFYRNFAQIVQDPAWNGVIILEADLKPNDLPPQIAGLAAGIDFTRFTAHHFGFTVSRVAAHPGESPPLEMQGVSSFFGLIDYKEPSYAQNLASGIDPDIPVPVPVNGDLQFTVLLLQVLFENARIANFRSNVQLTVQALFGSKVVQTVGNVAPGITDGVPMPANGIVLDGSYVAQTGADSTSSSYVFEQTKTTVFRLDSNALQAVAFDRIQLNTLSDDGTVTTSRFLVWGALDFVQLSDKNKTVFDVLSFGSADGTADLQLGAGLAFSNLAIGMSSPNATPNAQQFAVTATNIAYDLNASSARGESLFRGFGLQLKNFVQAGENQTPASFGFLPVTSELNLKTLTPPWFGLVYRVTLGGPGALASAAGFDSDLLVAWSPAALSSDKQQAVFIGLTLPGASPGAKLFSLQGVFKVAVGAISLLRQPVKGGAGMAYCLRLDDIGIKILGIAKLPPDATIQFFLFGDPKSAGSLGWYAAYVANSGLTAEPALVPIERMQLTAGDAVARPLFTPAGAGTGTEANTRAERVR